MTEFQNNKVISLFSGAGGFDIGLEMAGFKIAVAVEFDQSCCNTLRTNNPDLAVIHGDINKISTQELLATGGLEPTEAALVIGGPPCQSFSLAGKRMGLNDPRGRLVLEFIRVVKESLPTAFIMENVKGMVNWQGGEAINAIMREIADPIYYSGNKYQYNVKRAVLNAVDYGVPQYRERVFIVGNRLNVDFDFPTPTHKETNENTIDLFPETRDNIRTVWDVIGDLPAADEPSETAVRISQTIKKRIEDHGY